MSIIKEENILDNAVLKIAEKMILAARTAPKGRGKNNLVMAILQGDTIKKLSSAMSAHGKKHNMAFFERDANSILHCPCLVLMGTKITPLGLPKCGLCGYPNCEEKLKNPLAPCAFNTGDLGIAIGSAVSIAADARLDNRIMFSAGFSAVELGLLGKDVKIAYAIAVSASSKNPFFDRQ